MLCAWYSGCLLGPRHVACALAVALLHRYGLLLGHRHVMMRRARRGLAVAFGAGDGGDCRDLVGRGAGPLIRVAVDIADGLGKLRRARPLLLAADWSRCRRRLGQVA